jgi:hypothetical protein
MDAIVRLDFDCVGAKDRRRVQAGLRELVIAGWTGRNAEEVEEHIRELELIGVARPRTTPIFYRIAASLLTTLPSIQVTGDRSSGEVEAVLLHLDDGIWVGVGSDQTDRKVETVGVTLSKQICAKPVGAELWRLSDVAGHWDQLVIRSFVMDQGRRSLYQEGPLALLRRPEDLLKQYQDRGGNFSAGAVMFCGTMPVRGGVQPALQFELELEDPVLKRSLTHSYRIDMLPFAD